MSLCYLLLFTVILLLLIIYKVIIVDNSVGGYEGDYEEGEIITDKSENIIGDLKKLYNSVRGQHFVIDPWDGECIYIHDDDDRYVDLNNNIWRIV